MIGGAGKNYARHSGTRAKPAGPESITTDSEVLDAIRDYLHFRDYGFRAPRFARPRNDEGFGERAMAFGYRFKLERQRNGWWLVRFPGIPEALTEGETESEARRNAVDCVIAALEGYMKAGRPLPRQGAGHSGHARAVLPSLVTAKLGVYETLRTSGWSKLRLAKELGMPERASRRRFDGLRRIEQRAR
jgi:antitoxin HicB